MRVLVTEGTGFTGAALVDAHRFPDAAARNIRRARLEGPLLVDGHVHFHDCFDEDEFFGRAAANFRSAAWELCNASHATGVFLFGERSGDHHFRRFREAAGKRGPDGWRIEATDEDCSVIAHRKGQIIALIGGRQVSTKERLEVLALATVERFPDGKSLSGTLRMIRDAGALAAIPWGLGKWWFRRGTLVAGAIDAGDGDWLFLGDSAQRPKVFCRPSLFRIARSRGIFTLAGSDPLPQREQADRAGSYGFVLNGALSRTHPAEDLREILRNLDGQPGEFGERVTLRAFARSQLGMILRRLARREGFGS